MLYVLRSCKTLSRVISSISIRRDLKEEGMEVAKSGRYAGISDFSSLVELALDRLLHPEKYPPLEAVEMKPQEVPA